MGRLQGEDMWKIANYSVIRLPLPPPKGIWADVIVAAVDSHLDCEGGVVNYMGGWVYNPIRK